MQNICTTHPHTGRRKRPWQQTFNSRHSAWNGTTAGAATTVCSLTYGENEVVSKWASQDSYFLSFNRIQQERADHKTKQNKTKKDAPRKGRNLTSGGLLPYSLPHDNASSRPSPSSATCSSIKAVSIAVTALHHQLSLFPVQPPQSYWVCLSVTKLQTTDSGRRPSLPNSTGFSCSRNFITTTTRGSHSSSPSSSS